jgi:hypothetical protein
VGSPDATLIFFNDILGRFVETGYHTGFFELKSTDAGIDLATLREDILHQKPDGAPDKYFVYHILGIGVYFFHAQRYQPKNFLIRMNNKKRVSSKI